MQSILKPFILLLLSFQLAWYFLTFSFAKENIFGNQNMKRFYQLQIRFLFPNSNYRTRSKSDDIGMESQCFWEMKIFLSCWHIDYCLISVSIVSNRLTIKRLFIPWNYFIDYHPTTIIATKQTEPLSFKYEILHLFILFRLNFWSFKLCCKY